MKSKANPHLPRYVLDSGGLTSLIGRNRIARERMLFIAAYRGRIQIPAAILVECTTGDAGRDAEVNRVIKAAARAAREVTPVNEDAARAAGELRFRARMDDGIDALVAACAAGDGSPAVLLTSDPSDMQRLLSRSRNVTIVKV